MQEPSHRKSQQRPKSQARERRLPILARVAGWWICFTGWHFWVEEEDDPNFWWERADTGERMRLVPCQNCWKSLRVTLMIKYLLCMQS